MITLNIDKCVWVPSNKTLIAPKSEIAGLIGTTITYPIIITVAGTKADVQFFWDAERKYYKFDKILHLKQPNIFFDDSQLKQILIMVV